jgi:hypothetical protein
MRDVNGGLQLMGRTIPSFRIELQKEKVERKPSFRNTLVVNPIENEI